MAQSLLTTTIGFAIENETVGVTEYERFLVDGVPGDPVLPADQVLRSDNAPIRSHAINRATGIEYTKKITGAGISTWVKAADLDDILAAASSDSWRYPVKIKDDTVYADLAAAQTAVNTGTIDGVTLVDGDRILFTGITGANKNVFIVTGTPGGGATLVEDGNDASHNDTLKVDEGTFTDNEFHYNSTIPDWVDSGANGANEDGFQNTFIGKSSSGSELPDYTSQTVVTNGDNLEVATGKLDAAIAVNAFTLGINTAAIGVIGSEVDALETALGAVVDANGNYVPHVGTSYLDGNLDLTEDLVTLDAQIQANADALANVGAGASIIGAIGHTPVDSIDTNVIKMVRWMVHVKEGTKVRTYEVDATHDGYVGVDPTDTEYTPYARLKMNGNIPGFDLDVVIEGLTTQKVMTLYVDSTNAVDISTSRMTVI